MAKLVVAYIHRQGFRFRKKSKVPLTDDRPPCGKYLEFDHVQKWLSRHLKKHFIKKLSYQLHSSKKIRILFWIFLDFFSIFTGYPFLLHKKLQTKIQNKIRIFYFLMDAAKVFLLPMIG